MVTVMYFFVLKKHPMTRLSCIMRCFFIHYSTRNPGSVLEKQFCDLYSVGSSALSYLISAAPYIDAVLVDKVSSDSADENYILIGCEYRHRIDLVIRIIIQLASRSLCDGGSYIIKVESLFGDNIDGDCVRSLDRDSDACA